LKSNFFEGSILQIYVENHYLIYLELLASTTVSLIPLLQAFTDMSAWIRKLYVWKREIRSSIAVCSQYSDALPDDSRGTAAQYAVINLYLLGNRVDCNPMRVGK